jgi:hypothetical protein
MVQIYIKGVILMNNWLKFFELKNMVEYHDMKATNFRIPATLRKLIKEDMRKIEDKDNSFISLNEFLLLNLASGANYSYNTKTKEWYRKRNGANLENLYDLDDEQQLLYASFIVTLEEENREKIKNFLIELKKNKVVKNEE